MATLSIQTKNKKETQTVITILGALGIVIKEEEELIPYSSLRASVSISAEALAKAQDELQNWDGRECDA